eukprot:scaffold6285_cov121-Isochrysis_galbana.AAC.3
MQTSNLRLARRTWPRLRLVVATTSRSASSRARSPVSEARPARASMQCGCNFGSTRPCASPSRSSGTPISTKEDCLAEAYDGADRVRDNRRLARARHAEDERVVARAQHARHSLPLVDVELLQA